MRDPEREASGAARRRARARARRAVRRDPHLAAVSGTDRLPRAAPLRVRAARARRPARAGDRRRRVGDVARRARGVPRRHRSRPRARGGGAAAATRPCSSSSTTGATSIRRSSRAPGSSSRRGCAATSTAARAGGRASTSRTSSSRARPERVAVCALTSRAGGVRRRRDRDSEQGAVRLEAEPALSGRRRPAPRGARRQRRRGVAGRRSTRDPGDRAALRSQARSLEAAGVDPSRRRRLHERERPRLPRHPGRGRRCQGRRAKKLQAALQQADEEDLATGPAAKKIGAATRQLRP